MQRRKLSDILQNIKKRVSSNETNKEAQNKKISNDETLALQSPKPTKTGNKKKSVKFTDLEIDNLLNLLNEFNQEEELKEKNDPKSMDQILAEKAALYGIDQDSAKALESFNQLKDDSNSVVSKAQQVLKEPADQPYVDPFAEIEADMKELNESIWPTPLAPSEPKKVAEEKKQSAIKLPENEDDLEGIEIKYVEPRTKKSVDAKVSNTNIHEDSQKNDNVPSHKTNNIDDELNEVLATLTNLQNLEDTISSLSSNEQLMSASSTAQVLPTPLETPSDEPSVINTEDNTNNAEMLAEAKNKELHEYLDELMGTITIPENKNTSTESINDSGTTPVSASIKDSEKVVVEDKVVEEKKDPRRARHIEVVSEDLIAKECAYLEAYIESATLCQAEDNFGDLARNFDALITSSHAIPLLEANPEFKNKVREVNAKIVDVYVETYTAMADAQFTYFKENHAKIGVDDASRELSALSSRLSTNVKETILKITNSNERSLVFDRYLQVIKKLTENGNFFSASALYTGLISSDVSRLISHDNVYRGLSATQAKLHEYLDSIYNIEGDSNKLRMISAIRNHQGPKLPIISTFTSALATGFSENLNIFKNTVKTYQKIAKNLQTITTLLQQPTSDDTVTEIAELKAEISKAVNIDLALSDKVAKFKAFSEKPDPSQSKNDIDNMEKSIKELEVYLDIDNETKVTAALEKATSAQQEAEAGELKLRAGAANLIDESLQQMYAPYKGAHAPTLVSNQLESEALYKRYIDIIQSFMPLLDASRGELENPLSFAENDYKFGKITATQFNEKLRGILVGSQKKLSDYYHTNKTDNNEFALFAEPLVSNLNSMIESFKMEDSQLDENIKLFKESIEEYRNYYNTVKKEVMDYELNLNKRSREILPRGKLPEQSQFAQQFPNFTMDGPTEIVMKKLQPIYEYIAELKQRIKDGGDNATTVKRIKRLEAVSKVLFDITHNTKQPRTMLAAITKAIKTDPNFRTKLGMIKPRKVVSLLKAFQAEMLESTLTDGLSKTYVDLTKYAGKHAAKKDRKISQQKQTQMESIMQTLAKHDLSTQQKITYLEKAISEQKSSKILSERGITMLETYREQLIALSQTEEILREAIPTVDATTETIKHPVMDEVTPSSVDDIATKEPTVEEPVILETTATTAPTVLDENHKLVNAVKEIYSTQELFHQRMKTILTAFYTDTNPPKMKDSYTVNLRGETIQIKLTGKQQKAIDYYLQPLRELVKQDPYNSSTIGPITSENANQALKKLTDIVTTNIGAHDKETHLLADFSRKYTNFTDYLKSINENFSRMIVDAQNGIPTPLKDYLILPASRLAQKKLLMETVLKESNKLSDADNHREVIEKTIAKMENDNQSFERDSSVDEKLAKLFASDNPDTKGLSRSIKKQYRFNQLDKLFEENPDYFKNEKYRVNPVLHRSVFEKINRFGIEREIKRAFEFHQAKQAFDNSKADEIKLKDLSTAALAAEVDTVKPATPSTSPALPASTDDTAIKNKVLTSLNELSQTLRDEPTARNIVDIEQLNNVYRTAKKQLSESHDLNVHDNLKAIAEVMKEHGKDTSFKSEAALRFAHTAYGKVESSVERHNVSNNQIAKFEYKFNKNEHSLFKRWRIETYAAWAKEEVQALLSQYMLDNNTEAGFKLRIDGDFPRIMVKAVAIYCASCKPQPLVCEFGLDNKYRSIKPYTPTAKDIATFDRKLNPLEGEATSTVDAGMTLRQRLSAAINSILQANPSDVTQIEEKPKQSKLKQFVFGMFRKQPSVTTGESKADNTVKPRSP